MSIIIFAAYIGYVIAAVVVFRLCQPLHAAMIAFFGGWLFLPVADYPAELVVSGQYFTNDFIGTALPGSLLATKALLCPVVVLACLALNAPQLFRTYRPANLDFVIAAFCLSPLIPCLAGHTPGTVALQQIGYLTGTWGMSWLIGRLLLSDQAGHEGLTSGIIISGLLLLPIAVIEGVQLPHLYTDVFGTHPFQHDGAVRYLGFRPVGFFEHGNQYGIWIAMAALAAIGRTLARRTGIDAAIAAVLVVAAIAGQSVGAIILLLLGAIWLVMSARVRRVTVAIAALSLAIGGTGYVSGKLPLEHWAKDTAPGRLVYDGLRSMGRGSLGWRVKRDQVALPTIQQTAVTGHGTWDWWRPLASHPTGLPLLIAGQFGVIALLLATIAMFGGAVREMWVGRSNVIAVIIIAAGIDAWLNSFAYFPAILAAAALARPAWRSRPRTGQADQEAQPELVEAKT